MKNVDENKKLILETMIFFSLNKRLVTKEEIYQYQIKSKISFSELELVLAKIPNIIFKKGLYGFDWEFEKLFELRQHKIRESIKRFRKVRKYAKLIINIPFIKGAFLAGSTAFSTGNANSQSDIDVFIVTEKNRIWFARFLIMIITKIFRIGRRGDFDENLFCLNHFVVENYLQRSNYDIYASEIYIDFLPIGKNSKKILSEFWKKNNWIRDFYPNLQPRSNQIFSYIKTSKWKFYFEKIINLFGGDFINVFLKKVQILKINKSFRRENFFGRITFNDNELEFHPNSTDFRLEKQIKEFRQKYKLNTI